MFRADLHIHSLYSRATSKDMNLRKIAEVCEIKGIDLVTTGDFVHPQWLKELKENLIFCENGFYKLKDSSSKVQFIIGGEISSIYKKDGKVRKIHNMIYMPDIESAERLSKKLEKIGNIHSDGRPILGLDSKHLLELCLEVNENTIFIPAHIWTPWFSLFGKMSGFDDIEECFEDLTQYIYAVETGLSSDPPMNWKLSMLDRFTLVSNSDAHSPAKIAREANIFHCNKDYFSLLNSLKDKDKVTTIEFFPEEGKYHYDGHRKCNICLNPEEAIKNNNICPECGRPVTIGVLHRVLELADRKENVPHLQEYYSLVPLDEIISQAFNVKSSTKKVKEFYEKMIKSLGDELSILKDIPLDRIRKVAGELIAHGIDKMRKGRIEVKPGFDGEYGKIIVINEEDRKYFSAKKGIFLDDVKLKEIKRKKDIFEIKSNDFKEEIVEKFSLNEEQKRAIETSDNVNLIVAGPGTGKTFTLTERIKFLLNKGEKEENIYAITFTNKACEELKRRINSNINIHTFHSFSKKVIEETKKHQITIFEPSEQIKFIKSLINSNKKVDIEQFFKNLYLFRQNKKIDFYESEIKEYLSYLRNENLYDFDELMFTALDILKSQLPFKISHLLVDEFQDINELQFKIIKVIIEYGANFFGIGDPNQSIYGFRGSSNEYFEKLNLAKKIYLKYNYRSCNDIVTFSNKIIKTQIEGVRQCSGEVRLIKFNDDEEEAKFIAKEIKKLVGGLDFHSSGNHEEYFSFKDIAIIFRVHAIANKIKRVLKEEGIPFQEAEDIPLEEITKLNFEVEKVNLLSFHAAKGLEFKVVFIIGVEDKILPFSLANFKTDEDEERRLLYVGVTRAKDKLYILNSKRFVYGELVDSRVSRFLNEREFGYLKKKKKKKIKTIF